MGERPKGGKDERVEEGHHPCGRDGGLGQHVRRVSLMSNELMHDFIVGLATHLLDSGLQVEVPTRTGTMSFFSIIATHGKYAIQSKPSSQRTRYGSGRYDNMVGHIVVCGYDGQQQYVKLNAYHRRPDLASGMNQYMYRFWVDTRIYEELTEAICHEMIEMGDHPREFCEPYRASHAEWILQKRRAW